MPVALDDDLAGQFARMGVGFEGIADAPAAAAFEVMGQNAATLRIWLACETQWRVAAGLGGITWLGLDYTAVDVILRRSGIDSADQVFADLMVMEAEALSAFAEKDR